MASPPLAQASRRACSQLLRLLGHSRELKALAGATVALMSAALLPVIRAGAVGPAPLWASRSALLVSRSGPLVSQSTSLVSHPGGLTFDLINSKYQRVTYSGAPVDIGGAPLGYLSVSYIGVVNSTGATVTFPSPGRNDEEVATSATYLGEFVIDEQDCVDHSPLVAGALAQLSWAGSRQRSASRLPLLTSSTP